MAVIFGWVGSNDKLTGKYSQFLHETMGIGHVYRTTAPTVDAFVRHGRLTGLAEGALELLQQHHKDKPAYLLYFSNGGAFVHEKLLQSLQAGNGKRWPNVSLRGTVFDSAPAHLTVRSASRALTEGIKSPLARKAAYAVTYLLFAIFYTPFMLRRPAVFFANMRNDPLPIPSLYIFSATDTITEEAPLRDLVMQRRATHPLGEQGIHMLDIKASEGPSPHVTHLLKHRQRYTEACELFLQACAANHLQARL